MKKHIFILIGVFVILLGSFTFSHQFTVDDSFNQFHSYYNIASAQSEGGGGSTTSCFNDFNSYIGARSLECNSPCCYRQDYVGEQEGGSCSGSFPTCSY